MSHKLFWCFALLFFTIGCGGTKPDTIPQKIDAEVIAEYERINQVDQSYVAPKE